GVWISSGFGAHGLNTSALAGGLIARGIVDGDDAWRLFAPYELVWAGGKAFRAVAQAIYLGARPIAGMRQAWDRQRERAGRRRDRRAQERAERAAARSPGPSETGKSAAAPKRPRTRAKGEPAAAMLEVPSVIDERPDEAKKP